MQRRVFGQFVAMNLAVSGTDQVRVNDTVQRRIIPVAPANRRRAGVLDQRLDKRYRSLPVQCSGRPPRPDRRPKRPNLPDWYLHYILQWKTPVLSVCMFFLFFFDSLHVCHDLPRPATT